VPPDAAPDIEYSQAVVELDPFDQLTDPVLDGGVLDTDMLKAPEGASVESIADILDIVGAANVVNVPVAATP
jgi:hypothetical protein